MLLPFQWTILTIEDAIELRNFIEKSTSRGITKRDYAAMHEAGILPFYNKLTQFIEQSDHYENELKDLDTNSLVRESEH